METSQHSNTPTLHYSNPHNIMNIFTRIWTVIKANINDLINRAEDPEKLLEQSIREMQSQVTRMRSDVVNIIAEEKRLKAQLDKYQQEIGRWEKNAELALKEGKETLAVEALRRKKEATSYVQQLHPQWEQQVAIAAKLKDQYQQLRDRIQEAHRRKQTLVARLKHAETQKRLRGMLSDLSDGQVFDRFERKLADTEAYAAAQEELQGSSLEDQFRALESGGDVDIQQELEALKQKMELNP